MFLTQAGVIVIHIHLLRNGLQDILEITPVHLIHAGFDILHKASLGICPVFFSTPHLINKNTLGRILCCFGNKLAGLFSHRATDISIHSASYPQKEGKHSSIIAEKSDFISRKPLMTYVCTIKTKHGFF